MFFAIFFFQSFYYGNIYFDFFVKGNKNLHVLRDEAKKIIKKINLIKNFKKRKL